MKTAKLCAAAGFITYLFLQAAAFAQTTLTYTEAKNRMLNQYLGILAAHYDIDIAQANVTQAKLWNNPYFLWNADMYSVETNRYFSFGEQKLIQVEQIFSISGKHTNSVKLAKLGAEMSELQYADAVRGMIYELSNTYNDVLLLQEKKMLYDSISKGYERLIVASDAMLATGAISKNEQLRIKAEKLGIDATAANVNAELVQKRAELNVLLNIKAETQVELIDRELPEVKGLDPAELLKTASDNRPDYKLSVKNIEYNERDLKLQKSSAVPDLKLGYQPHDKGSNYYRSYQGMTFEMSLPFFNRNQGNIRAARVRIEQSKLSSDLLVLQLNNQVAASRTSLIAYAEQIRSFNSSFLNELEQMRREAGENYIQKNLTLVQFIDFQRAYIDTKLQYLELKNQYLDAVNDLHFNIGKEILK